ncbi:MAG: ATP-dependent zinc metalloprotease FtsH [Lachnospiraceae bacterium]|nr:ATP-dependent zinc metalloprotease FtsH [Lachnospiraceae bacterium]NBJ81669.1 ATP-dependent zinc metalloprotease FtsH [bacterium 1XD42-76]NBK05113.1 ATP-dependent zinc metalloprotease FtsH [bacterium 1XD42-94]
MKQNQQFRGLGLVLLVIALCVLASALTQQGGLFSEEMSHQEFMVALENKMIEAARVNQNRQTPTGSLDLLMYDGDRKNIAVSDVIAAEELLKEYRIDYQLVDVPQDNYLMTIILPIGLSAVVIVFIIMYMNARIGNSGGNNTRMMNFGKSRARMSRTNSVNFSKVAGLAEEKEELEEIVDFLKNPKKYTDVGARIPKGVILVGPPGTGKTLLGKAVAGEAGVPFFSISGSDFVEMFVGVGASRVRDLFEDAKKNAPCIVFIDEIDAVARRRGTGMGGGHDEREQTLNQLLVEMDGFGVNEGIIVMAATNRVDILDPAILRPGRFDRKIGVGRPDVRGREEILTVHAKEKPLGEDVDLGRIARTTAGFTGADLENLLNEAAILAAKRERRYILQADIDQAFVKVGIGAEKKSRVISEKEKKITAYHEAGHAILFHELPDVGPVHTISIIPTGTGAAGYTMPLPERDEMFNTKGKMLQSIMVALGGRIAEEIIFQDVTTGASQDIRQATSIARAMVTQYGMSEKVGMIHYGNEGDEVFIGRDLAQTRSYGENVATSIDGEIKRIIDECYDRARQIILAHEAILHRCCELLIEKEKIGQEEFEELFA